MQICYLYYSHVCFIPLSSFYRLTFLHFDILSIANSDEIGDLISIRRPAFFRRKIRTSEYVARIPLRFSAREGRGSGREKPNYGAFFLPMPTGSHICLSLPLRNFCKAVSVCLPRAPRRSRAVSQSSFRPPSCCSCVLCEMRNCGGVSPAAMLIGLCCIILRLWINRLFGQTQAVWQFLPFPGYVSWLHPVCVKPICPHRISAVQDMKLLFSALRCCMSKRAVSLSFSRPSFSPSSSSSAPLSVLLRPKTMTTCLDFCLPRGAARSKMASFLCSAPHKRARWGQQF